MTSATIQNISSLAASTEASQAARNSSVQRQISSSPTPQDIQQIKQISSDAAIAKVKIDKEREPDQPKRSDASFGAQEDKEDYQFQENKGTKRKSKDKVDVVA